MRVKHYAEWIQLVASFTVNSLKSWQWAATSVYYLLGLWSRLVSSVPYLQGEKPALLWQYVPDIINTYITSRYGMGLRITEQDTPPSYVSPSHTNTLACVWSSAFSVASVTWWQLQETRLTDHTVD